MVVILLYLVAVFAEPVATYQPEAQDIRYSYIPPTVHPFRGHTRATFHLAPFVYGIHQKRDLETLALVYAEDTSVSYPLAILCAGRSL